MRFNVSNYRGFTAFVEKIENGFEARYCDTKGQEIDREVFMGIEDYRQKQEHIDAQLKKFWEHRIDSN